MADGSLSRVLVTGGAGFIGGRVVRALLDEGHEVTSADRHACHDPRARSVVGDLRDPAVIETAARPGTDTIIHLAAVSSVLRSLADPAEAYEVNVGVTAELLETARQRGIGTFLLASTNAVAGDVGHATITEQVPLRPLTPYGATKAAAEMLLGGYARGYGMTGAALRFTTVYGPGAKAKDGFVTRVMQAAASASTVRIYGDGSQVRDLVHVDDIVSGILAAWRARHSGPLVLGSGDPVTVNEVVQAARAVTGAELPAEHVPPQPGEMPAVIIDISAARSLGYRPGYDLKAGLATVWPEFSEKAK